MNFCCSCYGSTLYVICSNSVSLTWSQLLSTIWISSGENLTGSRILTHAAYEIFLVQDRWTIDSEHVDQVLASTEILRVVTPAVCVETTCKQSWTKLKCPLTPPTLWQRALNILDKSHRSLLKPGEPFQLLMLLFGRLQGGRSFHLLHNLHITDSLWSRPSLRQPISANDETHRWLKQSWYSWELNWNRQHH